MAKPLLLLLPGLILLLTVLQLPAQTADKTSSANAAAATPSPAAPAAQAPDDATKKLTELVHARKYTEAQQLTSGLLVAYPDDQRLIKAKALIEKLLSPAASASATPGNNQLAANPNAEQLTGMDKVDYNALIQLARQAQQNADLAEQKKLLQQFMGQSNTFLQQHPDQILVWQLRAASAISLNDPMAGYEAGQKLLAAGAANSNDPNLEQLLAQLRNKGWLDKQEAEKAAKGAARYGWLVGAWSNRYSTTNKRGHTLNSGEETLELSITDSHIAGYLIENGVQLRDPYMTLTILDSGEARCDLGDSVSVLSCNIDGANKTIKIVFQNLSNDEKNITRTFELKK